MYEHHFGLEARPFRLAPDPAFMYWTRQHRLASNILQLGLQRFSPITVVTGEIGAGKTILIQGYLTLAPRDVTTGLVSNFTSGKDDLGQWALMAFGQPFRGLTTVEQSRALERFLLGEYAAGRRTVLVVDEAQNLGDDDLEALRLLTNINSGKDLVLMLLLVGQPELRERLKQVNCRQIMQRVGAHVHLGPMSRDETRGYVRHRLSVAGGGDDLFDDAALDEVHAIAGGVPRVTNVLCELCLVTAYGDEAGRIDAGLVRSVVEEARGHGMFPEMLSEVPHRPRPTRPKRTVAGRAKPAAGPRNVIPLPSRLGDAPASQVRTNGGVAALAARLHPTPEAAQDSTPALPATQLNAPAPDDVAPEPPDAVADVAEAPDLGPGPDRRGDPKESTPKRGSEDRVLPDAASEAETPSDGSEVGETVMSHARPAARSRKWPAHARRYALGGGTVLSVALLLAVLRDGEAPAALPSLSRTTIQAVDTIPEGGALRADEIGPAAAARAEAAPSLPPSDRVRQTEGLAPPAASGESVSAPVREGGVASAPVADLSFLDAEDRFRTALDLAATSSEAAAVAYARAAMLGHTRAAYYLGQLYETGDGVPVDLGLARAWYEVASTGEDGARRRLAGLPPPAPGQPQAPVLLSSDANGSFVELVWTTAHGPDPEGFFVEFSAGPADGVLRSERVETSAVRLPRPSGATQWRVRTAGPKGTISSSSPWQRLAPPQVGSASE